MDVKVSGIYTRLTFYYRRVVSTKAKTRITSLFQLMFLYTTLTVMELFLEDFHACKLAPFQITSTFYSPRVNRTQGCPRQPHGFTTVPKNTANGARRHMGAILALCLFYQTVIPLQRFLQITLSLRHYLCFIFKTYASREHDFSVVIVTKHC